MNPCPMRCLLRKKNVNAFKLDNNLSRAKSKIVEYALCNPFDYFFTGTLDPNKYNRYDFDKYMKDFSKFCNNYKNRHSNDFIYLFVPELHKDGAIHTHGFLGGLNPNDIFINEHGHLEWKSYSEKFGFMSFDPIRNREASAFYCTKYITKDIEKIVGKNKQLFRCSKGLECASTDRITNVSPNCLPWDYENDYVSVMSSHSADEILSQITLLESFA